MEASRPTPECHPSHRLDSLPGYGRGRAAQATVFRHRLGSNEAPDGPDEDLLAAIGASAAALHRYPDLRGETLAAALANRHQIAAANIAVAAGSVVLLDQLIRAYCDPGDEIVTPWRSYEAYKILVGLAGAKLVEVPLDTKHRADPATILAAVGTRTRIVLLCNPNNPTGTSLDNDVIDRLIDALPRDVLVILDEAYADFADSAVAVAALPAQRLARHPNLAVLRTFSKAWGLAGMRVGYCLSSPRVIGAVHSVAPPFPLPGIALAAALAALSSPGIVAARVARNAHERTRLTNGLCNLGLPVAESKANFVWLPVGDDAETLAVHFANASIAVRCFAREGVRITTGTPEDTAAVLAAAKIWRKP